MKDFNNQEARYNEIRNEIQKNGYKTEEKKQIDKLIKLFKEMLIYKNKSYDDNWSFDEWIDNIDTQYHFFNESLDTVVRIIKFGYYIEDDYNYNETEVSDVEKIIALQDLYKELIDEDEGYKKFAYYYNEIELKDGQTYSDVYELEKKKMVELFKEMLEFVNVKCCDDSYNYLKSSENEEVNENSYSCDIDDLMPLIKQYYPYYNNILNHLSALMWSTSVTYIVLIDSMEKIYESLSKSYKNREKDLQEYKKLVKKDEDGYEYVDDMLFFEDE